LTGQTISAGELDALLEKIRVQTEGEADALVLSEGVHLLGRAQAYLRESEARQRRLASFFEQLLDTLPASVALLNSRGDITFVNQAWRRFGRENGLRVKAGFAMNYIAQCREASGEDADLARAAADGIRRILARRQERFELEYPCHSQTERRWFRMIAAPMTTAEDDGAVVMHINVTERVLAEQRLMESERQLRHAQRLESVGQLTGGIAHDFNNLLTVIIGRTEDLETRVGDSESRHIVEEIARASHRAAELTAQLLAFGRRQHLAPEHLYADAAINSLLTLLRRTLGENVHLSVEPASEKPWLMEVDRVQFDSALINLCINARDAMPEGGNITIVTSNRSVSPTESDIDDDLPPGDYIQVSVADTGTGIEASLLDHVIEPFFTTKAEGEGSGLGLSMVYGFVRQSGGNLVIHSTPGEGTTVNLWFPRAEAAPRSSDATATGAVESEGVAAGAPRPPKVLLVEDDAAVLRLEQMQLASLGFDVTSASDGANALQLAEALDHIDYLVTDLIMPGTLTGYVLASRVRQLHPEAAVVFASGYTVEAALSADPVDGAVFLKKPFRRRELAEAMRRARQR